VSLAELAVVVALLGVLATVSVVSLRGGSTAAGDRAAQSDVDAALTAAANAFGAAARPPASTDEVQRLLTGAPILVAGDQSPAVDEVSLEVAPPDALATAAAAASPDGACWFGVLYFRVPAGEPLRRYGFAPAGAQTACTAAAGFAALAGTPTPPGDAWGSPRELP
jgi:type II secretory pathway pseudopilin PulG